MSRVTKSLGETRTNLFQLMSSVLLLLSPFLSWISVSTSSKNLLLLWSPPPFRSNLWEVAGSRTGIPISATISEAALVTALLLILGGVTCIKSRGVALPIVTMGLFLFLVTAYPLQGQTQVVNIVFNTSFDIGFYLALVGLIAGVISTRFERWPLKALIASEGRA